MADLNDTLLGNDSSRKTENICPSQEGEYALLEDDFQFALTFCTLTPLAAIGLIGNTLSFLVMNKETGKSSSTFILKLLAVSDNFVLILTFLFFSMNTFYLNTGLALGYKKFYELFGENLFGMTVWMAKVMSVYLTLYVTAERYYAVTWPLKAPTVCTVKNAKRFSLGILIFAIIYNLPKYVYFPVFKYRNDTCLGMVPWAENLLPVVPRWYYYGYVLGLYLLLIYFIPLSTLSVLNILLVNNLRKSNKQRQEMSSANKKQDRITEKIIGIVTAFIILESPAVVLNVIAVCFPYLIPFDVMIPYLSVTYVCGAINSIINFYIYIVLGKKFRQRLMVMLGCKKKLDRGMSSMRSASAVSVVAGKMSVKKQAGEGTDGKKGETKVEVP